MHQLHSLNHEDIRTVYFILGTSRLCGNCGTPSHQQSDRMMPVLTASSDCFFLRFTNFLHVYMLYICKSLLFHPTVYMPMISYDIMVC